MSEPLDKLSDEDLEVLEKKAEEKGMSVEELIQELVVEYVKFLKGEV